MDEWEKQSVATLKHLPALNGKPSLGVSIGDNTMSPPTYPAFTVSPCKNGYIIQKGSDRWVATNEDQLVEVLKVIAVTEKVSG